ncbi:MAG: thioredoxin family protein [Bacteroidetes bacterium]|jgi:glutaredoxin|nr:thioredoxin family protein [Patescibacteria group bacterium]MBU2493215.1 thioredoxin family protein [Bacteroidota bacterium]
MAKHTLELFYGLTCPHCRALKRMLKEILLEFDDKYELNETLVSLPKGWIKSAKLGIHSVPVLSLDDEIIFRGLPSKEALINKLKERS